jgi:hypothetical protein
VQCEHNTQEANGNLHKVILTIYRCGDSPKRKDRTMASVQMVGPYFYDFGSEGLKPGNSHGVFVAIASLHVKTSTMTAIPFPVGGSRTCSLSVGDVAVTREPVRSRSSTPGPT